ncbi:MAG: serine/threonine protein phosphatase [Clostridiales bacterium]|jgi:UDP-2,3-diacylglucosamine pyrophosphatase LpxH|nr:metallophosphoesterase family protein [Bacillota bacterium]NLK04370.1 serine/threonine protein phosphatase [Clostridiales bacterium]
MNTEKRLTNAYKEARIEYFDKNSKYIIFSDTHRGDDSVSDEFARNQAIFLHVLNYYNNNDFVYIEAGDGDELWEHKNFKHIRLAHKDIFIVLKKFFDKGRLRMIYGNHNIFLKNKKYVYKNYNYFYDEYNQKKVDLFPGIEPIEALLLKHRHTNQEIFIVHGHQGDFINDQLWYISMFLLRYLWRFLHIVGFENPASPARNLYRRHKVEKNYNKWIRKHKIMLICGHTHRAKFPKKDELPYFNTGCCINTRGIPGIEIVNESILLVDWRIKANDDGVMCIERTVVRGPEPIDRYDCINISNYDGLKTNCIDEDS